MHTAKSAVRAKMYVAADSNFSNLQSPFYCARITIVITVIISVIIMSTTASDNAAELHWVIQSSQQLTESVI